ncbi:hypothetical protein [Azospirillum agricola]|uniref:hypothetical protein n=1 Tax=Azospirillum agricola TaxID=1720247 RepID=UPI001178313F|nr:hypothetical protein [Azospirillum agricola]
MLTILVEGTVAGGDAEDDLDALCLEVEDALRADPTLGGRLEKFHWEETAVAGGEGGTMVARMSFSAAYYSHPPSEDGPFPPRHVYGSWEPNTGPPHLPDYREIADGRPPEMV